MGPLTDTNPPTAFNDLPLETVVEILSRLPVKTLIRSTSVNKSWYGLIINPQFFAAQIRRSISLCYPNAVLIVPSNIFPAQNPCALFSVDTLSVIEKFEVPFSSKSKSVKLAGSLNGLLCLTDASPVHAGRDLYLWNPSVRRYKYLVSSCFKEVVGDWIHRYCVVGLGFHKPSDDYRVVRIVYRSDDRGNHFGKVPPKVEIFSLRRNTWRKLKDPVVPRIAKEGGIFVNGSVYWLEAKKPDEYFKDLWILSFDFGNEVFAEVKLPDKVRRCLGEESHFRLMEVEGSVAVCVYDVIESEGVSLPCCIWVMRRENGVVSWTRRFRVVMNAVGFPLEITKSGTLIIESWERMPNCDLLSCNLKNMHYKNLGFGGLSTTDAFLVESMCSLGFGGPSIVDTSFVESLVLLDGGHPK